MEPMACDSAGSSVTWKPSPKPAPSAASSLKAEIDISFMVCPPGRWFMVMNSMVFGEQRRTPSSSPPLSSI